MTSENLKHVKVIKYDFMKMRDIVSIDVNQAGFWKAEQAQPWLHPSRDRAPGSRGHQCFQLDPPEVNGKAPTDSRGRGTDRKRHGRSLSSLAELCRQLLCCRDGHGPSPWEYQKLFTGKELSSWEGSGALEFLCKSSSSSNRPRGGTKGKRQYMFSPSRPVPSPVSAHHPSPLSSMLGVLRKG